VTIVELLQRVIAESGFVSYAATNPAKHANNKTRRRRMNLEEYCRPRSNLLKVGSKLKNLRVPAEVGAIYMICNVDLETYGLINASGYRWTAPVTGGPFKDTEGYLKKLVGPMSALEDWEIVG
jgi:hypothetical protein